VVCECEHNTAGATCDSCLPLFHAKPWLPGLGAESNACQKCSCNNHADACHYDVNLDLSPESRLAGNGGVCDNCEHNTVRVTICHHDTIVLVLVRLMKQEFYCMPDF